MMNNISAADEFEKNGYIHVSRILDLNLCHFLTHTLLKLSSDPNSSSDGQVPGAAAVLDKSLLFETLLERFWPKMEFLTGKSLLPTYSFSRLYVNGNVLEKHSDRPECEISVTIQLGRSHHYSWPIFMNGSRYDLGEGDAVIYKGCDYDHWRDACDGPEGYYSGQVFLHYVDANGPYADRVGDRINRNVYPNMFIKNRSIQMDLK